MIFVNCAIGADNRAILISVGDLKSNDFLWKKEICRQIYDLANQVGDQAFDITCREIDTTSMIDKKLPELAKVNNIHLRILRNYKNELNVEIINLHPQHDSDFKTLSVSLKDAKETNLTKEQGLAKVLTNVFYYAQNEMAFKAGLLAIGANESSAIEFDEKRGIFLDRFTGEPISIKDAYGIFEKESPRKKNYLRAGIEIGVLLSAGMAVYYKNLGYNAVDFDYTFQDGIKKKFNGDAIRFDDNDKFANYGHTYAGMLYYQMARSNGFNSLESFLVSFASSTVWEFFEYHEVLSINDQVFTGIGGYIVGEASYQLSCALFQKNNTAANVFGYMVSPGNAANAVGSKKRLMTQTECGETRWSDISLYLGLERGQKAYQAESSQSKVFGIDATVLKVENFRQEGKTSEVILDTSLSKTLVEFNGNQGLIDLKVITQITSAAYHEKNISRDSKNQLKGYELLVGVGSAATWNDRGAAVGNKNEDFFGTIDVIGATAYTNFFYNGFIIKADISFYGNMAMVKSYSLEPYKQSRGDLNGLSSVIKKRGYYWGLGTTTIGAISIEKGRFEVGLNAHLSHDTSVNSKQRYQEQITENPNFEDSVKNTKFYFNFKVTKNLTLQISREFYQRSGSINNQFHTSGTEKRTSGKLIYKF